MGIDVKVRITDGKKVVARLRRRIRTYEKRYEISSAEMAALLTSGYVRETAEMLRWMHDFRALRLIRAETPITGIASNATSTSTNNI